MRVCSLAEMEASTEYTEYTETRQAEADDGSISGELSLAALVRGEVGTAGAMLGAPVEIDFVPVLICLGCLLPLFALLGAVGIWRWKIARRKERVPVSERLLRPAGESVRKRVEELQEQLSEGLAFMLVVPLGCVVGVLGGANRGPDAWWAVGGMGALVALGLGVRVMRVGRELRNHRLGFHGERAVGEELNQLMLQGCRVFHDLPMEPYGNIDYVVVAPSGVYAVETKTRRKRSAPPGRQREHEVIYDGKALQFPHGTDVHGLEQARQQAQRLGSFLAKAVGEPVKVAPILTLPGWWVTSRVNGDLKVVNPKGIGAVVANGGRAVLEPQLMQRIAHQLDQKCRDVEL